MNLPATKEEMAAFGLLLERLCQHLLAHGLDFSIGMDSDRTDGAKRTGWVVTITRTLAVFPTWPYRLTTTLTFEERWGDEIRQAIHEGAEAFCCRFTPNDHELTKRLANPRRFEGGWFRS